LRPAVMNPRSAFVDRETEDPSPGRNWGLSRAKLVRTDDRLGHALKCFRPSTRFVRIGFYVGSAILRLRYRLFSKCPPAGVRLNLARAFPKFNLNELPTALMPPRMTFSSGAARE
jgi:hypothetical protein